MIDIINGIQSYTSLSIFAQTDFLRRIPLPPALVETLGGSVLTLGKALLILIVGLIITNIVKKFVKSLLDKTDIDNKIAAWITGDDSHDVPIEEWVSGAVGWLMILFVALAVLNVLELDVVSAPLNTLLQEITKFLPRVGGAALLLGIAFLLATVVKLLVTRSFNKFKIDEKLNAQVGEDSGEGQISLGETIGNTLYWLVFLFFLPNLLSTLELQATLGPLQELINNILAIVPNILGAVIIGAVGWVIAQIIKKVVVNLLTASGINQIGENFGLSTGANKQSLAQIIGSIVYVFILIPISITALDTLQIEAISKPATEMLNQVLELFPKLFAATVILGLAYVGGQYISELVSNLLSSIGFDNIFKWLGFNNINISKTTTDESDGDSSNSKITQTPSQLVGIIVLVAIMLVAALTAVDILKIEALRNVVSVALLIGGQVLVGMVIFAVGLYFANLAFNLISASGTHQSKFLAQAARVAIIVLVSAMTLERIGVAPNIVNLAFGLLTGGIAVAIALAFGLGGREAAGKVLQEWLDSFKE